MRRQSGAPRRTIQQPANIVADVLIINAKMHLHKRLRSKNDTPILSPLDSLQPTRDQ